MKRIRGAVTPTRAQEVKPLASNTASSDAESEAVQAKSCCWSETDRMYELHDPSSLTRRLWTFVVIVCVSYNAAMIPARWAFVFNPAGLTLSYVMDYMFDLILLIDIVWNFFVGFMENGIIVTRKGRTVKHYIRSPKFHLDVLSAVPVDLMFIRPEYDMWHAIFRFNRLIRFHRAGAYFYEWERSTAKPVWWRALRLFLSVFLLAHWTSCSFYGIVWWQNKSFNGNWPDNSRLWAQEMQQYIQSPFWQSYPRALFWALTLLTGTGPKHSRPSTDVELYFMFILVLIAVLVFGVIIGSIGQLISNSNEQKAQFKKKLDTINVWMAHKGIDGRLQTRIRSYYEYLWSRQLGIDDKAILSDIPKHLRGMVYNQLNFSILRKVPLFANLNDDSFVRALVWSLRPEIYTPDDFVVRQGEMGSAMYFVIRGHVVVFVDHVEVNQLHPGSYFGEVALLFKAERNASIVARTFVDVFTLEKEAVDKALLDFPQHAQKIYDEAQMRLSQSLAEQRRKSMAKSESTGAKMSLDPLKTATLAPPMLPTSVSEEDLVSFRRSSNKSSKSREGGGSPGAVGMVNTSTPFAPFMEEPETSDEEEHSLNELLDDIAAREIGKIMNKTTNAAALLEVDENTLHGQYTHRERSDGHDGLMESSTSNLQLRTHNINSMNSSAGDGYPEDSGHDTHRKLEHQKSLEVARIVGPGTNSVGLAGLSRQRSLIVDDTRDRSASMESNSQSGAGLGGRRQRGVSSGVKPLDLDALASLKALNGDLTSLSTSALMDVHATAMHVLGNVQYALSSRLQNT